MEYRLGDIVKVNRGASPRPIIEYLSEKGFPWLKISDFKLGDRYVYDTKEFIKKEGVSKTRLVAKGTLILTNSATPGIPIFLGRDMCLHDGFLYFSEIDEKIIRREYLYYWFLVNRSHILNNANGSVFKNLKKEIVENLKLEIPSINEQLKIIEILDNINKKIELNNQINNNLQKINNTIFTKWFWEFDYPTKYNMAYKSSGGKMVDTELGKIPENWKVGLFQDLIDFSNGYSFKSSDLLDKEEEGTLKVFKQGNINLCGGINEEKTKSWIYKEKCIGLKKFILKKGDILMCMTDMKNSTSPLLGHTALMNVDNEYIVNQRVGLIRCKKEITDYPYVYTMTNLECFLRDIRSRANSGVQVNLSTKGICETRIIIPTKDIIDKYNNVVKPLYEKIFNNQKENQNLKSLKEIVLPKLLNGELNIEDVKI